jgi:hypothetical protein
MAHSSAGGLSVLILGGSGLAGKYIASALLATPDISVVLGTASPRLSSMPRSRRASRTRWTARTSL